MVIEKVLVSYPMFPEHFNAKSAYECDSRAERYRMEVKKEYVGSLEDPVSTLCGSIYVARTTRSDLLGLVWNSARS
jgi:hypothetical protein